MMRRLNWCGSVITLLMENVSTITDVQYVIKKYNPNQSGPHFEIYFFSVFFHLISSSCSADNWRQTNKKWKTLSGSKSQQFSKIIMSDFLADFGGGGTDKFCKIFDSSACILCVYNLPDSKKWQVLKLSFANYCKDLKSFTSQLSVRLWYSLVIKI